MRFHPTSFLKVTETIVIEYQLFFPIMQKLLTFFFVKIVLLLGVTLGHDETNSGSISTTIKNAITVGLGEIFSYTLDISTTTGKCSNHKFHYKQNQIKKKDIDAIYESCDIWASQYKHCQRHNGPEG